MHGGYDAHHGSPSSVSYMPIHAATHHAARFSRRKGDEVIHACHTTPLTKQCLMAYRLDSSQSCPDRNMGYTCRSIPYASPYSLPRSALPVAWCYHPQPRVSCQWLTRLDLERWYVGGSFALGFFPVIVGAARSTFGASKVYQIWYVTHTTHNHHAALWRGQQPGT